MSTFFHQKTLNMKFVLVLLMIGILTFLVKASIMVYEALNMNFEFDLLWPEDEDWILEYKPVLESDKGPWKKEIAAMARNRA